MKLIIDIPEEQYNDIVKHLTDNDGNYAYSDFNLREIIRNGTPYNPTGDLISREALKEKITRRMRYAPINENAKQIIITAILSDIDEEQAVEHSLLPLSGEADNSYMRGYEVGKAEGILKAETRPKGEWIYHDKLNMYYCKDCGLLEPFTKEEIEEGIKLPNFCQQCGADMRGDATNEKA